MSEFIEHLVTEQRVPTARLIREFFRGAADAVNKIGPWSFRTSTSPLVNFAAGRRINAYSLVALTYAAVKAQSPGTFEAPPAVDPGFRVFYTRPKTAGRLLAVALRARSESFTFFPANSILSAAVFKNNVQVGSIASVANAAGLYEGGLVDVSAAAGATLAAEDLIEVRITGLNGPWGPARLNWSAMLLFSELLVTY